MYTASPKVEEILRGDTDELFNLSLEEQLEIFVEIKELCTSINPPCDLNPFFNTVLSLAETHKAGDNEALNEGHMNAIIMQIEMLRKHSKKHGLTFHINTNQKLDVDEEDSKTTIDRLVDYQPVLVTGESILFPVAYSHLQHVSNNGYDDGFYTAEIRTWPESGKQTITSLRPAVENDIEFASPDITPDAVVVVAFNPQGQAIEKPISDPTFYIPPTVEGFMSIVFVQAQEKPQKVLISGPQGTGKTSVIRELAARHEYNFFQMPCGLVEAPSEWFGYLTVENGEVKYVKSAFIEACETPNTIILLDEFNRVHSAVSNSLYNILDDFGFAWLDRIKQYIRVASGVIFASTCNIGVEHTGTFQIDRAMLDRFAFHIEMTHLDANDEIRVLRQKTGLEYDTSYKLVQLAEKVRAEAHSEDSVISTTLGFRQLEAAAILIAQGMPAFQAIEFTVLPMYSEQGETESQRAMVHQIVQGIFSDVPPRRKKD